MEATGVKKVRALLNALGPSAKKIAETLGTLGIKGRLGEPCDCPIYRYLTANGVDVVEVCGSLIELRGDDFVPNVHVVRFIDKYDNLHYPELVERRADGQIA